jgi:hypothetical protein
MSKVTSTLGVLYFLSSAQCYALDPYSTWKFVSEVAGAVAGATDSFSELFSSAKSESTIKDEVDKMTSQLDEIYSLAQEAGYTKDELSQLGSKNDGELASIRKAVTALTNAISFGKKFIRLFQTLDQKAASAQIEATGLEREELAQLYRLVRLQKEANLAPTKVQLLDLINKRRQISALREELKKKGAKTFGSTGVLAFPLSERVIETSLEASTRLRVPLIGLVLVVFLVRLIFYQFGLFGVTTLGDLVRDTVLCSFLLMVYPQMVRGVISFSLDMASRVGGENLAELRPKELNLPSFGNVLTSTKLILLYAFEWIKYAAYGIIDFFMTFGLSFLVLLFPLVIFASQMMNLSIAWPLFLGSFTILALWPLFWNLVGFAASLSWGHAQKTLSESIYSVFFTVLQIVSPVLGMKLISGQTLMKSMKDSIQTVSNPASAAAKFAASSQREFSQGRRDASGLQPRYAVVGMSGLPSAARAAGSAVGFMANQRRQSGATNQKRKSPNDRNPGQAQDFRQFGYGTQGFKREQATAQRSAPRSGTIKTRKDQEGRWV